MTQTDKYESAVYEWLEKTAKCGFTDVELAARTLMSYYQGAETYKLSDLINTISRLEEENAVITAQNVRFADEIMKLLSKELDLSENDN